MYKFICVCGKTLESRTTEGRCPFCDRLFELYWRADEKTLDKAVVTLQHTEHGR